MKDYSKMITDLVKKVKTLKDAGASEDEIKRLNALLSITKKQQKARQTLKKTTVDDGIVNTTKIKKVTGEVPDKPFEYGMPSRTNTQTLMDFIKQKRVKKDYVEGDKALEDAIKKRDADRIKRRTENRNRVSKALADSKAYKDSGKTK